MEVLDNLEWYVKGMIGSESNRFPYEFDDESMAADVVVGFIEALRGRTTRAPQVVWHGCSVVVEWLKKEMK